MISLSLCHLFHVFYGCVGKKSTRHNKSNMALAGNKLGRHGKTPCCNALMLQGVTTAMGSPESLCLYGAKQP